MARQFLGEVMDEFRASLKFLAPAVDEQNTIVVLGVSGDLSKKKLMPTLWVLYREDLLPPNTKIVGYGRGVLTVDEIRKNTSDYVGLKNEAEKAKYEEFWKQTYYFQGQYDQAESYAKMVTNLLQGFETGKPVANRLYYFAIPPTAYATTAAGIHGGGLSKTGWNRLVIEKPFGSDLQTSDELTSQLAKLFTEDQLYRIDHYLGKEMVQNLITLRFANRIFSPEWNAANVANVEILFKEPFGTQGRGGFFDEFGIIRDMVQSHLLQVLCLVAMEKPLSSDAEKIRDQKLKVLQAIETLDIKDVVLGQYVANPEGEGEAITGYLDDASITNKQSTTATFSLTVLHINNDRWKGVPFLIRAGKALNESRVEVRIQYKNVDNGIFGGQEKPNRTIMRIQPNEAIYERIMIKKPGMGFSLEEAELDLTYSSRFKNAVLPDAYERLLLDVFAGSQSGFVRSDELREAWRILTPVLHQIDAEKKKPITYVFGSQGPKEADELSAKYGLIRD